MNRALFSSATDDWATPEDIFQDLDKEFHFTLDPCADTSNHKCEKYFDKAVDGLSQNWGGTRYFVILRMAGSFLSGLKNLSGKDIRIIRLSLC